jgi:hypothetical protein
MKEQIADAMDAWNTWGARYKFEPLAIEQSLVSEERKFGGTFDAALTDGQTSIIDWKTGNAVYADDVVQIAAYGHLWDVHNPDNPAQRYHLLRISKEDASFHHHSWPAKAMQPAWEVFRHARQLYDLEKTLRGSL